MAVPKSGDVYLFTATVLVLGTRGTFEGAPFELVGRTCVRGRRGAIWNEWKLRFDDGRTMFLTESAGTFALFDDASLVPAFEALVPDAPLDAGYVVVDRGQATRVAGWGEIDADTPPTYFYVDLSSKRDGSPATIDFGELQSSPGRFFLGKRVSVEALGLTTSAERPRFIRTPDVSRPKDVDSWLEVGDEGDFDGIRYRVIGMLGRSSQVDDDENKVTRWEEYLLHEAHAGLRWLVVTEGNWSVVEPVDAGVVTPIESESVALRGVTYEATPAARARVDWASGELPWEIAVGDATNVRDFIEAASGTVLTKEWTEDEVSWSRSVRVETAVIAKAFDKRTLPKPT